MDFLKVWDFVFKKGIELEKGINYFFIFEIFEYHYTFIDCAKNIEEIENIILSHYYSNNEINGLIIPFIDEKKLLNYLWERYCILNTGAFNALIIDEIDFK